MIADVDCTVDGGKPLCEKYGVEGFPTIKYFSKDTADTGEAYEGERDYKALKKFVKKMSKDPCVMDTLENCNKEEKKFIEEIGAWDGAKIKAELDAFNEQLDAAKKNHTELKELFEKQKDEAIATMKLQEEAKKELDALYKKSKYKLNILTQKTVKKEEL